MIQFFESGGQSIGVSASTSVIPMNIQDWFPLGWTGWISLLSKGLSRVFSNTTVQKHQFSMVLLTVIKYWWGIHVFLFFFFSNLGRLWIAMGFPSGSVVKNLTANAENKGDLSLIPGLGRSPGGGNINTVQYSCLENPMDRGTWWATIQGVAMIQIWLNTHTHTEIAMYPKDWLWTV